MRRNLQKVYELLEISPPHRLFSPISDILKKTEIEVVSPKAYIAPVIDGKEGNYFEWLNAGSVEVAAIGVPSDKSGEVVKVFVVKKDQSLKKEDIINYARENLTGYKVPKHVEFRQELPKSNVGKILRRVLREEEDKVS